MDDRKNISGGSLVALTMLFVFILIFYSPPLFAASGPTFSITSSDVKLYTGWDFIASPFVKIDGVSGVSFSQGCGDGTATGNGNLITSVYHYVPSTGAYENVLKKYNYQTISNALKGLEPGLGYWVYYEGGQVAGQGTECVITFSGSGEVKVSDLGDTDVAGKKARLSAGWNQISGTTQALQLKAYLSSEAVKQSLGDSACVVKSIYGYDPIKGVYFEVERKAGDGTGTVIEPSKIESSKAYWVYAEKECTLPQTIKNCADPDKTPYGKCIENSKPRFCDETGNIVNKCELCGCLAGTGLECSKTGSTAGTCVLPELPVLQCTDTDGGVKYDVKGTAGVTGNTGTDYCLNDKTLVEYSCTVYAGNVPGWKSEYYDCPTSPAASINTKCKDGACEQAQEYNLVTFADPNGFFLVDKPSDWAAELKTKFIEVRSPDKTAWTAVWPIAKIGPYKGQNALYISKHIIVPFFNIYYKSFSIGNVYKTNDDAVVKIEATYEDDAGVKVKAVFIIVSKPGDAVAVLDGYAAPASDFSNKEQLLKAILKSYKLNKIGELLRKTNAIDLEPIQDEDKYFTGYMPKGWKVAKHHFKLETDGKNCLTIPLMLYDPNNPANMIFVVPEMGQFYGSNEWREYERATRITTTFMGYFLARPLTPHADNPVVNDDLKEFISKGLPEIYHVPTDKTYYFDYVCELSTIETPLSTCTQHCVGLQCWHYKEIPYTNYQYYLLYPHIDDVRITSTYPADEYYALFGDVAALQFNKLLASLGVQTAVLGAEFTAYSTDIDAYKNNRHEKATPAKAVFLVGVHKSFEYPIPFSPDQTPKELTWYGSIKFFSADKDQYAVLAPTLIQSLASIRYDNGYLGFCRAIQKGRDEALIKGNKDFDAYIRGEEYLVDQNGQPYVGPLGTAQDAAAHPENYPQGPFIPVPASAVIQ